ncbi:hypothetical protein OG601_47300 [Streptomyces sp. NBC_01239]|uniref:hypothetical protein n=1 Tax=Streptomyces sp. NBC_01239 TaxID=2903792 RepID=UPI00224E0361|nr:hypothetical protein [Streptomyces sp. NBC_01239]MCX4816734.1 hypothetical protein [Streptomyces sp. NBC_01239]MCX4818182.1 hypothetical protein [Streptomyces sp. NBC_01239]
MPAQPEPTDRAEVTKLAAAVEEALATVVPTHVRHDDPSVPTWQEGGHIGTAAPVPQPGIPPMSARTTEISRAVMYCSMATVPPGLIAVAVMVASEHANPTVIGMICAAPAAVAIPILALARLIRRAGEAAPAEIHQTYTGNVHQETRITHTRAVWSKNVTKH